MLRYFLTFSLLAGLAGCSFDFTDPNADVTTTSPTIAQVTYCRNVMYINPELEIDPVGYSIETGMDDVIRFKFIAIPAVKPPAIATVLVIKQRRLVRASDSRVGNLKPDPARLFFNRHD